MFSPLLFFLACKLLLPSSKYCLYNVLILLLLKCLNLFWIMLHYPELSLFRILVHNLVHLSVL